LFSTKVPNLVNLLWENAYGFKETDYEDQAEMRVKWIRAWEKHLEKIENKKRRKEESMKKRKLKVKVRNNHINDFEEEFEEIDDEILEYQKRYQESESYPAILLAMIVIGGVGVLYCFSWIGTDKGITI